MRTHTGAELLKFGPIPPSGYRIILGPPVHHCTCLIPSRAQSSSREPISVAFDISTAHARRQANADYFDRHRPQQQPARDGILHDALHKNFDFALHRDRGAVSISHSLEPFSGHATSPKLQPAFPRWKESQHSVCAFSENFLGGGVPRRST